MSDIPDEILYDVRLVERHIRKGLITREEVEKRLEAMKDMKDDADSIALESLVPDSVSKANGGQDPLVD